MAQSRVPVLAAALDDRLQVAAIDFGTTYSGYALSFTSDFHIDPLKVITNNWASGAGRSTSLKTSSCILFRPNGVFDSFGFEAEDKYAELALDDEHRDWYYFKRFKMLLYDNRDLSRGIVLCDAEGKEMPAMKVFSEGIRYLKDHLLTLCEERSHGLMMEETHWVLTVPAIWADSAKQFMREAAINAGIPSEHLSLALEPEAASLFCKHLPVEKVSDDTGSGTIGCFSPGKKYLVLDAGGGTVDITVHETQRDGTVRELYKANGGPWGGTKIDEEFLNFLTDITGAEVMKIFKKEHRDDYLDLMRDFEVKKTGFTPNMEGKVTFKIPISLHETFRTVTGQDFRQSLIMKHDLKENITFAGDKLRAQPAIIRRFFDRTCDAIAMHLKEIFRQPNVQGTSTVLMVGGFSESGMLQAAMKDAFPDKRFVIPSEAGLAVLKGAVIFGHNPTVISTRVSKFTYGIGICKPFQHGIHPEFKRQIIDGLEKCTDCFDKHVEMGEEVKVGKVFEEKSYIPSTRDQRQCLVEVYTSQNRDPEFVDDRGCEKLGSITVDLSNIRTYEERGFLVKMIYGDTELGVQARVEKTGQVLNASMDFLG